MENHFWIPGREGKGISAVLHQPDETVAQKAPAIIYCHGFTGSKTGANRMGVEIARELCQQGYLVIRFDYIGSGESEGDFAKDTYFSGWIEDVKTVLSWVNRSDLADEDRIGLIGHSLSGAIVTCLASIARIKTVCTLAPVFHLEKNYREIILGERLWRMANEGQVIRDFFNKKYTLEPLFVADLKKYEMKSTAEKISCPLFIIHGKKDQAVPYEHSYDFLDAIKSGQKRLELLEDEEHIFTPRIYPLILAWFKSTL